MGGRGRAALSDRKAERSGASSTRRAAILYTAQDLARFCEVDLKTIHHWADAGKIPHHRTEGRHLRFRRNHVLAFLRRHDYPLHAELMSARPTVFFAVTPRDDDDASASSIEDVAKKLSGRFFVRRFESALMAIAHLVAEAPDVVVLRLDDPTLAGARSIGELKARPETSWPMLVVLATDAHAAARDAGADLVVEDLASLSGELARSLAVT